MGSSLPCPGMTGSCENSWNSPSAYIKDIISNDDHKKASLPDWKLRGQRPSERGSKKEENDATAIDRSFEGWSVCLLSPSSFRSPAFTIRLWYLLNFFIVFAFRLVVPLFDWSGVVARVASATGSSMVASLVVWCSITVLTVILVTLCPLILKKEASVGGCRRSHYSSSHRSRRPRNFAARIVGHEHCGGTVERMSCSDDLWLLRYVWILSVAPLHLSRKDWYTRGMEIKFCDEQSELYEEEKIPKSGVWPPVTFLETSDSPLLP